MTSSSAAATAAATRLASALHTLSLSSEESQSQSFAVQSAYKRAIAATLTNQSLIARPQQQQQQLHSLSIAFHTAVAPESSSDVTTVILADPTQSGPALFTHFSQIWKQRGVAWMRGHEEPCQCARCAARIARTPGAQLPPPTPTSATGSAAAAGGGSSAWNKPPAILAPSLPPGVTVTTKAMSGKQNEHQQQGTHGQMMDGTSGAMPLDPHSSAAAGASVLTPGGDSLDAAWSNSFAASPLSAFNMSAWSSNPMQSLGGGQFPPSNLPQFPQQNNAFASATNSLGAGGAQFPPTFPAGFPSQQSQGQEFGDFFQTMNLGGDASKQHDLSKANEWNGYNTSSLASTGANQWDAKSSAFGANGGLGANLNGGASTLGASPAESMELVTNHFASLTAAHGGQLPVNQAALDSLIASASAMPTGPEQQQLLAMIDMLLQLHTGQTNAAFSAGGLAQSNAANQSFPQTGSVAQPNAYDQWNGGVSGNNMNGLNSNLNNGLNSASSNPNAFGAMNMPFGNSGQNFNDHDLHHSNTNPAASRGEDISGGGGNHKSQHSVEWGANGGAHSTSSSLSGGGHIPEFSPLRPARTSTNTGYDDVPETASPFSYNHAGVGGGAGTHANDSSYTNLSVSARPFQPTQSMTTSTGAQSGVSGSTNAFSPSLAGLTGSNGLLLQQQLSLNSQQQELNASLAALQGVATNTRQPQQPIYDVLGNGGMSYDDRDRRDYRDGGVQGGMNSFDRDRYSSQGGLGGGRLGGGQGGLGLGGQQGAYPDRRLGGVGGGGRSGDYARSGMDRFDYIQQQVNQSSKSKLRPYDNVTGGGGLGIGGKRSELSYAPDFATPGQLQSLQQSQSQGGLSTQQQGVLARLLAQSISGEAPHTQPTSAPITSAASGQPQPAPTSTPTAGTEPSAVLSAEAALKQLTASPEFQLLSPAQQAQIYLSVQQVASLQQGDGAVTTTSTTATASAPVPSSVSPVLGALQSPLSSAVLIRPGARVEDTFAQMLKPDLAKLSELLRQQQVAITNAALGNSSTPAAVVAPEPQPDKSKLRPPKPRSRRTEFPDEAQLTANEKEKEKLISSTPASTPAPTTAPVDAVAFGQLQSVLSNSSLTHSARVATIRNVSASASATAFANAFVNAIVQHTVPKEDEPKQEKHEPATATAKNEPAATSTSSPTLATSTASPTATVTSPATTSSSAMRVRKRVTQPPSAAASAESVAPATASAPKQPSATVVPVVQTPTLENATPTPSTDSTPQPVSASSNNRDRGGRNRRGGQNPRNERKPRSAASTSATTAVPDDAADATASPTSASETAASTPATTTAPATSAPTQQQRSNDRNRRGGQNQRNERTNDRNRRGGGGKKDESGATPTAASSEDASSSSASVSITVPSTSPTTTASASELTPASASDTAATPSSQSNRQRQQQQRSGGGDRSRRGGQQRQKSEKPSSSAAATASPTSPLTSDGTTPSAAAATSSPSAGDATAASSGSNQSRKPRQPRSTNNGSGEQQSRSGGGGGRGSRGTRTPRGDKSAAAASDSAATPAAPLTATASSE